MSDPILIQGYRGMDNVSGGGIDGESMIATPRVIINAIPDGRGHLVKRDGYTSHISLTGAHSLWSGASGVFCAGESGGLQKLYKLNLTTKIATALCTIKGPKRKLYYVQSRMGDNDVVFIANKHWCGAYESGAIRTWGSIVATTQAMDWRLEENGAVYFLDDGKGRSTATPRPHEYGHAPSGMDFICAAFGRIWGARNRSVYYSDAASPEVWQDDVNHIPFPNQLTMIAPTSGGIYFGMEDHILWHQGPSPNESKAVFLDIGAIEHTLQYNKMPFGELPSGTPIWTSRHGIHAGLPDGNIITLTEGKLKYDVGTPLGAMFLYMKKQPQYVSTFRRASSTILGDSVTAEKILESYRTVEGVLSAESEVVVAIA